MYLIYWFSSVAKAIVALILLSNTTNIAMADNPVEFIADNNDAHFSQRGAWNSAQSSNAINEQFVYAANPASGAPSPIPMLAWTAELPYDGEYQLFFRWVQPQSNTTNLPLPLTREAHISFQYANISALDRTKKKWKTYSNFNQTVGVSQWTSLGNYPYYRGLANFYLKRKNSGIHSADAIKWIYLDTIPPSMPSDITVKSRTPDSLVITWQAATDNIGVSSYAVYRNEILLRTTKDLLLTETNLSNATSYTYKIIAVDKAGNSSTPTFIVAKTLSAKDPLYALSWSGSLKNYISPMYWVRSSTLPQDAKNALDAMPSGKRAIISTDLVRGLIGNENDKITLADGTKSTAIWCKNGAEDVLRRTTNFFGSYRAAGGKLDYFITDYEEGFSIWHFTNREQIFPAIEKDSRYKSEGFNLRTGLDSLEGLYKEIYSRIDFKKWNSAMSAYLAELLTNNVFTPIKEQFFNVKMSNYGHYFDKLGAPDFNGHHYANCAECIKGSYVGTHQSRETYGRIATGLANYKFDGTTTFGKTPFSSFIISINSMRTMTLSSSVPVMPWLGYKNFDERGLVMTEKTDLYQEIIYHVALTNPEVILYWNPRAPIGSDPETFATEEQDILVNNVLDETNTLIGYSGRKTLATQLSGWYDPYVLTGMQVNDQSIWRFTPSLDSGQDVSSTLVSSNPLTLKIKGKKIVVTDGKIYEPIKKHSAQGLWIIAPANTQPEVTNEW